MTNDEMLAQLDLTMDQLLDLLQKLHAFVNNLDSAQQTVVLASMPALTDAAAWFGPSGNVQDLQRLLEQATPSDAVACIGVGVGRPPSTSK